MDNYKDENDQRRHQRRPYSKIIPFVIQGQSYLGVSRNISPCGVFMEAKDNISAKENYLSIVEAELIAEVAWIAEEI